MTPRDAQWPLTRHPVRAVVISFLFGSSLLALVGLQTTVGAASSNGEITITIVATPRSVAVSGGLVTLVATVTGASICTFSAMPAAPGFAGTTTCTNGVITRSGRLSRNDGRNRAVVLEVTASSSTTLVTARAVVEQTGVVRPISTASSIHRRNLSELLAPR